MLKGLEELKRIEGAILEYFPNRKPIEIIEKELKVLEIIIKKANIRVYHYILSERYFFKTTNNVYEISKEKYDLLKDTL